MVEPEAQPVLTRYGLNGAQLRPIGTGLINRTYRVDHPSGTYALQRLNPTFGPEVNEDLECVTEHLAAAGMTTPRLVRTLDRDRSVEVASGVWRVITWVDGRGLDRFDHPRRSRSAGRLLGRFHGALRNFTTPFAHTRIGVHDTKRHLERLRCALGRHPDHPSYAQAAPVGEAILDHARRLPALPLRRERVVHGDPKASNLLFDPATEEAVCLVDLDTMARMPTILELGDAFRSWCSTGREDDRQSDFDLERFEAAVAGYANGSSGLLATEEQDALVSATETIATELAARFLQDALEERYFGWNRERFPSRSAHNLVRARNQLALARAIRRQRGAAEARAKHAFRGG